MRRHCRRARGVIAVRMRHQHLREWRALERAREVIEMRLEAGPGIDQRRHATVDQIGPVAIAGVRSGIVGVEWDRIH